MIEENRGNPYLSHSRRICGVQEFPIAVLRLRNSFEQRIKGAPAAAQDWLAKSVQIGIDNNFFREEDEGARIERRVGSGFITSVYQFTANEKPWVVKIGARKAPVPGWFDPSSQEYAEWYANNLKIVQDRFKDKLPHLIPSPQYVTYPSNDGGESTSVVIQPYIADTIPVLGVLSKSEEVRRGILDELHEFYEGFDDLYSKHNFIPDFGSRGNLAVQFLEGEYHLTLLDNGMIDFNAVSPILNAWSMFCYRSWSRRSISKISRSLR